MSKFWDTRYSKEEYIYGEEPNVYFSEKLKQLEAGSILLPAEGEGRNAVFAALNNWVVQATDQSLSGKKKAQQLAEKHQVEIDYLISDVREMEFEPNSFDALAMIFAHFQADEQRNIHKQLASYIKPGGYLILEGFNKSHAEFQKVNPTAGGPKDLNMLYSLEEIKDDFKGFEFLEAEEKEVDLSEGEHHKGASSVIRIFAIKK